MKVKISMTVNSAKEQEDEGLHARLFARGNGPICFGVVGDTQAGERKGCHYIGTSGCSVGLLGSFFLFRIGI